MLRPSALLLATSAILAAGHTLDWDVFEHVLPHDYFHTIVDVETLHTDPLFYRAVSEMATKQHWLNMLTLKSRQHYLAEFLHCSCPQGGVDVPQFQHDFYGRFDELADFFHAVSTRMSGAVREARTCTQYQVCVSKFDPAIVELVSGRYDDSFRDAFWQKSLVAYKPEYFKPIFTNDVWINFIRVWERIISFYQGYHHQIPFDFYSFFFNRQSAVPHTQYQFPYFQQFQNNYQTPNTFQSFVHQLPSYQNYQVYPYNQQYQYPVQQYNQQYQYPVQQYNQQYQYPVHQYQQYQFHSYPSQYQYQQQTPNTFQAFIHTLPSYKPYNQHETYPYYQNYQYHSFPYYNQKPYYSYDKSFYPYYQYDKTYFPQKNYYHEDYKYDVMPHNYAKYPYTYTKDYPTQYNYETRYPYYQYDYKYPTSNYYYDYQKYPATYNYRYPTNYNYDHVSYPYFNKDYSYRYPGKEYNYKYNDIYSSKYHNQFYDYEYDYPSYYQNYGVKNQYYPYHYDSSYSYKSNPFFSYKSYKPFEYTSSYDYTPFYKK